jgi:threonine aldolase
MRVDLRSDTVTRPTLGMRAAIAAAEVGDEQKREDPTVNELERRGAELLGQAEAVFLPTATMANQIALRLHGRPGDELYAEATSHVLIAELGGPALHSGLMVRALDRPDGVFGADDLRGAIRPSIGPHVPRPRVVVVENTHNSSGGCVWTVTQVQELTGAARELELRVHLDGARVLNAATALGVAPAELCAPFDTVTLCLSKGLGCPLGALLAGGEEAMVEARRLKHVFGGAMRQAGIVAAAGVYALDHHVARLADDHARARRLADGLAAAGLPVDPAATETNFVQLDARALGLTAAAAAARIAETGVLLSATIHPGILRAVTHLDVDDTGIDHALTAIPEALRV